MQLHNNAMTGQVGSLDPIVANTHSKLKKIDQFHKFVL